MALLTVAQLISYAQNAGFRGENLAIIVAIAQAESGGDTSRRNSGGDRGVLQINSKIHSEISDACAFDPACSFSAAYKISNGGSDFKQWCTAWSDGACGKKGGEYLGSSSPFTQFMGANSEQPGTPPINTPSTSTGNPLQDWVNSIQPAVSWIANPARIAKLVTGAILLIVGLALLIFPDQSQQAIKNVKGSIKNVSKA